MGVEYSKAAIARYVGVTFLGVAVLAAGAAYGFKGGTSSSNYTECKSEVIACTGTGGLAKYAFCNWQEPVDDSGSGSEIHKLYWTLGRSPKIVGVDWTVGASATVSGSIAVQNFQNYQTASGVTVLYSTGRTLVNSGNYLRGVTLAVPGAGHTSVMVIDYCTRLSKF